MFSQLKEEVGYVGREVFWAIPIKNSNSGTGVNNRVPEMNFGGREVEYRGDTEGDQTKGLKVRERSPLKIMIRADEESVGK